MFTIIVPVALIPAIASLVYYQGRASKIGIVQEKSKLQGIKEYKDNSSWMEVYFGVLKEIDIIGLLLLGTSLALILLPLSLYRNPEMAGKIQVLLQCLLLEVCYW